MSEVRPSKGSLVVMREVITSVATCNAADRDSQLSECDKLVNNCTYDTPTVVTT